MSTFGNLLYGIIQYLKRYGNKCAEVWIHKKYLKANERNIELEFKEGFSIAWKFQN